MKCLQNLKYIVKSVCFPFNFVVGQCGGEVFNSRKNSVKRDKFYLLMVLKVHKAKN